MPWEYGGNVNGEAAKTNETGTRVEALWGGEGVPDGPGHGHIVSNDGINADHVREPGASIPVVDNNLPNPYGA